MSKAWIVIKEIIFSILLIGVALGLNYYLFMNLNLDDEKIVSSAEYTKIEQDRFRVINGNIQDVQNPTLTYATTSNELEDYQSDYRYIPGTINPFITSDSTNDLPTELVEGVQNNATNGTAPQSAGASTETSDGN